MSQKRWMGPWALVLLLWAAAVSPAQQSSVELLSQEVDAGSPEQITTADAPAAQADVPRGSYVLGPGDVVMIWAVELEETANRPQQIDSQGFLNVPLAGRIQVVGMRVDELERELNTRLKVYIKEPNVSVSIQEYRSQPVTVVGAVRRAGVHQLQGQKTLLEVISMAEGLREDAGFSAKVTRRLEYGEVPLANAQLDATERFSVAEVDLEALLAGKNPQQNILMMPNDVVSIPRAHMVYVIGAVERSGGFALAEQSNISALQALALAGGLVQTAAPNRAKILRPTETDNGRVEIALNLKDILKGKEPDVQLGGEDILFVPQSGAKQIGLAVGRAVLQAGSSIAIWRIGRSPEY
jgi:polysaccharide export outer membrane protein